MQHRPLPTRDAPPSLRTTVSRTSAPNAPRMAPPRLTVVAGARLEFVPAANAARPTSVAFAARTVRNPDLGVLAGRAHSKTFADAASKLTGKGIVVPAGTTHVWEVPCPRTR